MLQSGHSREAGGNAGVLVLEVEVEGGREGNWGACGASMASEVGTGMLAEPARLLNEGVTLDGALGAAFHSQGRLCEEKFLLAAFF